MYNYMYMYNHKKVNMIACICHQTAGHTVYITLCSWPVHDKLFKGTVVKRERI